MAGVVRVSRPAAKTSPPQSAFSALVTSLLFGQFFEKGALICEVEDTSNLEAEIAVSEDEAPFLELGYAVSLKARSLPFRSIDVLVDRIAPLASTPDKATQSTVTIYCRLQNPDGTLRSGMTGFGRVSHRLRPLGFVLADRALRFLRTEFGL